MSVADVLAGKRQWWVEQGDVRERLRDVPSESINCVVTSVPYWGLRDYGTGRWEGGDSDCTHKVRPPGSGLATVGIDGGRHTQGHQQEGYRSKCGRCGAVRVDQQIGLEETLGEHLEAIVGVFREVRRVLRPDGVCWLNAGDAYETGTRAGRKPSKADHGYWQAAGTMGDRRVSTGTLKPKNLIGLPWRYAFALQDDGWYLRSDVIWSKPSPMPESVTDRPTRSHEYLFLFTKSGRYWYDADAIREPHSETSLRRVGGDVGGSRPDADRHAGATIPDRDKRWNVNEITLSPKGRNRWTVWTIASEPFPDAHFATFPTALVEPCILAGCPEGGVVLDPFSGSGTTVMVALRHNRRGIGLELNPAYVEMSRRRIVGDAPMFNAEGVA